MSLTVSVDQGIAEVYLDHPPVNALDSASWTRLSETFGSLGRDEAVRVVILAARGRGFCAGVDIKELAADSSSPSSRPATASSWAAGSGWSARATSWSPPRTRASDSRRSIAARSARPRT
jgi:enoyl-CoA hydratase/carnithine racemase